MTENQAAYAENTTDLLIEPKPLAPQDILTTVDIVSKQKRLGDAEDVPIVEGHITVGHPIVYTQVVQEPNGAKLLKRNNERIYLVQFPFTLHPLSERQCTKLRFQVSVMAPSSSAYKLIPDRVTTAAEVSKTEELDFSISLPAVGAKGEANTTNTIKYMRLSPIIKSYGLSQEKFYWIFEGSNGEAVEDGSKVVAAVLKVPQDTKTLKVTLGWQVDWQRYMFDIFRNVPAEIKELVIDINLQ